jgi:hypothetical protein
MIEITCDISNLCRDIKFDSGNGITSPVYALDNDFFATVKNADDIGEIAQCESVLVLHLNSMTHLRF